MWNKDSFNRSGFEFVIPPGNTGYVYFNLDSWKLYLDGKFELESQSCDKIIEWLNANGAIEI